MTKTDPEQLLRDLTQVFRTYGYEGASLTRISESTGLKRASLYHRFPGGKDEMAAAVLENAGSWVHSHALGALKGSGDPAARLRRMAKSLKEFYDAGECSCLLEALSFEGPDPRIRDLISDAFQLWFTSLGELGREAGLSPAAARRWATDVVVRVQGALVLARGTGDTAPFLRVLRELPDSLVSAGAEGGGRSS